MGMKQMIERLRDGRPLENLDRAVIADELERLDNHANEALEYLNLEDPDGVKDAFKELRRAFGLVNRWKCAKCGNIQSSHDLWAGCSKCKGKMETVVVRNPLPEAD